MVGYGALRSAECLFRFATDHKNDNLTYSNTSLTSANKYTIKERIIVNSRER